MANAETNGGGFDPNSPDQNPTWADTQDQGSIDNSITGDTGGTQNFFTAGPTSTSGGGGSGSTYHASGGSGGSGGGSSGGSNGLYPGLIDPNVEALKEQAIEFQANLALNQARVRNETHSVAIDAAYKAAQMAKDFIDMYGSHAIDALNKAGSLGLGVADVLSKLQGPSNAFAYDRAVNGFQNMGLGNAVGALTGQYRPAQFGAQGPTQPLTLASMNQQLSGQGGQSFTGGSIIDQLLGTAAHDRGMQNAAENGWTTNPIPQFDASGNQISGGGTAAGGGAPAGSWNTGGGVKTADQMFNELKAAGWGPAQGGTRPDDQTIANQYAATTGKPVTAGGATPGVANPGGASDPMAFNPSQTGSVGGYSQTASNYLSSLPKPGDVNARNFYQLPQYSQDLAMGGYSALGYDPNQLSSMWKNMLPQTGAGPSFAMVS